MIDKRSRVGMVALQHFAEHGIKGTTIPTVLTEAGVQASELTPPIETETDLLVAAHEVLLAEHYRVVNETLSSTDDSGLAMERMADSLIARLEAGEDLEYQRMVIQIWAIALENHEVNRMLLEQSEPARQLMIQHFSKSQKLGIVRSDIDAAALYGFLNCVWTGMLQQTQIDPHFDAVAVLRTSLKIYRSGVFASEQS